MACGSLVNGSLGLLEGVLRRVELEVENCRRLEGEDGRVGLVEVEKALDDDGEDEFNVFGAERNPFGPPQVPLTREL